MTDSRQRQRARDVELVRALAHGDRDALAELYDRLAPMMMALLVRMLPSRAEAEEQLQNVFVELWRRAGQYQPSRGSVRSWALTVTRSRALDALRAGKRRRARDHEPSDDATLAAPTSARPDEVAAARQDAGAVSTALAALSAEQRQALEMSYFGGLSHREIADQLGIPLGTVKSRIIAGMKVLRRTMTDEEAS